MVIRVDFFLPEQRAPVGEGSLNVEKRDFGILAEERRAARYKTHRMFAERAVIDWQ